MAKSFETFPLENGKEEKMDVSLLSKQDLINRLDLSEYDGDDLYEEKDDKSRFDSLAHHFFQKTHMTFSELLEESLQIILVDLKFSEKGMDKKMIEELFKDKIFEIFICSELKKKAYRPPSLKEKIVHTQSNTPRIDLQRLLSGNPRYFIKTKEIPVSSQENYNIIVPFGLWDTRIFWINILSIETGIHFYCYLETQKKIKYICSTPSLTEFFLEVAAERNRITDCLIRDKKCFPHEATQICDKILASYFYQPKKELESKIKIQGENTDPYYFLDFFEYVELIKKYNRMAKNFQYKTGIQLEIYETNNPFEQTELLPEEKKQAADTASISSTPPSIPLPYEPIPETFERSQDHKKTESSTSPSLMTHEGYIDPRYYRKVLLTSFSLNETKNLIFSPFIFSALKNSIEIKLEDIKKSPRNLFCKEKLAIQLSEESGFIGIHPLSFSWTPLPGLFSRDQLVNLEQETLSTLEKENLKLEIRFATETQQYFARVHPLNEKKPVLQKNIYLRYAMCPKSHLNKSENVSLIELPNLLLQSLNAFFDKIFSSEAPDFIRDVVKHLYTIIFIKEESEKISELIKFCRGFVEKSPTDPVIDYVRHTLGLTHENQIHFFSAILSQAGVCAQRSKIFMILAHYFGIPARMVRNDDHEYIEYYQNGDWQAVDLGGGQVDVRHVHDIWSQAEKEESFRNQQNIQSFLKNRILPLFNTKEIQLSKEKSWWSQLAKIKHPLLQFKEPNQTWSLHTVLMKLPKNKLGKNYFYIHKPADIDLLLKQLYVGKNGLYEEKEGPLLKLIKSGKKGTLLINWSLFNERQIANFKSILDKHPTLQGYPVSKKIRVISLIGPNTSACSAFYSRIKRVAWPNYISEDEIKLPLPQSAPIDLYESRDWESRLVGSLFATDDVYRFNEGILLKKLYAGEKSLTLTGCPPLPSFQVFLNRIRRERGFYANAEWHAIPEDFVISLAPLFSHSTPDKKPYTWDPSEQQLVLYINRQNYHQLFERFSIRSTGQVISKKGFLETLKSKGKPVTLVVTDHLEPGEIRRLESNCADPIQIRYLSYLIKSPPQIKKTPLSDAKIPSSSVIFSNDLGQAIRQIRKKEEIILDISEQTEFCHLFELIQLQEDKAFSSGKRFTHQTFLPLKTLQEGKTVILKGTISSELYHQLETLFSKNPYLIINGEIVPIKGKLILVTPPPQDRSELFSGTPHQYSHTFDWGKAAEYVQATLDLSYEETQSLLDKIKIFFDQVKTIPHNGKTTPPHLSITEERILQFAKAMKAHPDSANPVKSIFHLNYTDDKEIYSKLCVLAKKYLAFEAKDFSEDKHLYDVDKIKYQEIMRAHKNNLSAAYWQLANCFSPDFLKKIDDIDTFFFKRIFLGDLREKIKYGSRFEKQTHLVAHILKKSPFIELRGTTGAGKTFFIETILKSISDQKIDLFCGEEMIMHWLNAKGENKKYLIIDHANMRENGTWDFLKGLQSGKIFYQGHEYYVSPETHKVIFTGNSESSPGRNYHDFLQHVPKVHFKSYSHAYLEEHVILPFLKTLEVKNYSNISENMLTAFSLIKNQLPSEKIGIRDLKSLLDHFKYIVHSQPKLALSACTYLACVEVFSGLFKDIKEQNDFLALLKSLFGGSEKASLHPLPKTEQYILPISRQRLWHNVLRTLELREMRLEDKTQPVRSGILIEGPSGIGKSEMMLQALKYKGYKAYDGEIPDEKRQAKLYFHITMGSQNIQSILLRAYHLGAIVVMDELNLLTQEDEALLKKLLEGKAQPPPCHDGFCLLASQNPQHYAGRKPLSSALLDCFDHYYEQPYTREDLLDIVQQSNRFENEPQAHLFVEHFLKQQASSPQEINMRNFFEELGCFKKPTFLDQKPEKEITVSEKDITPRMPK